MATSESDDFESADEEMGHGAPAKRGAQSRQWSSPAMIDSDSDDDTESRAYVPSTPREKSSFVEKSDRFRPSAAAGGTAGEKTAANDAVDNASNIVPVEEVPKKDTQVDKMSESSSEKVPDDKGKDDSAELSKHGSTEPALQINPPSAVAKSSKSDAKGRTRPQQPRTMGAKKLGTRISKSSVPEPLIKEIEQENVETEKHVQKKDVIEKVSDESCEKTENKDVEGGTMVDEQNMPEELKSNKKFKEVFKPQGWEGVGNDVVLSDDLTEDKIQPVLDRLSTINTEPESSGGWGSWGSWGVSSLINTATAGVSTLSNHVSQGLTLLEGTMTAPDLIEPIKEESDESKTEDSPQSSVKEDPPQSSFGFGHIMSGVSSITKLVESTGGKVVIGTLEAIGQKAMEVLQEGDPGLKKKRAFLLNEGDKPNLSRVLREAKEKADAAERSLEEKQLARKVHFESLFDDYQGLVHLEALEMLSKQSSIKIQQHLVRLDSDELTSMQETLEEVKELCDLGDDDDEETFKNDKDLKEKLADACHDLGVSITYEKLHTMCDETNTYLATPITHTSQEIFQCAISTIAQFTAYVVERFHKTAELLLIKERRSTVNEADSLVQLTRILSNEIGTLANSFCKALNDLEKTAEKTGDISANITTIFMEASNASSYVQDAFRLLIPILQVGAI